jgi:hypothetical protein
VVNTGSRANYLAVQDAFRSSLSTKQHLVVAYTADDQLYMTRSGRYQVSTAFEMVPARPIGGSYYTTTLAQIEAAHGDFLATISFLDADR